MSAIDNDQFSFAGKTVIVTGGNGGIGQGIVTAFSERHANVVIADHAPAIKPVTSAGTGAVLDIRTDITDRQSVDAMVQTTLDTFGRIDVLVNNAGGGKGMARLLDVTPDIMEALIKLNIYGTMNCTQAVAASMVKQQRGSIVNISSCAALSGVAGRYDPVYAGCKGYINALTKALATDLGEAFVRVNAIAPAWIVPEADDEVSEGSFWRTMPDWVGSPQTFNADYERTGNLHASVGAALAQLGRPRDIANAAIYFASDAARHITGQMLSVCGGVYMPS